MIFRIPTTADPFYEFSIDLEGREYVLAFRYNQREDRWYMSLYTGDRTPIALSVKLVSNYPLLGRKRSDPNCPPGVLYVSGSEPPGLLDLQENGPCELLYVTSDEDSATKILSGSL